jgi:hypothetical protein
MAVKHSTEVAYGFGQMGSILITGVTNAVTCALSNRVFVAIQFLEDTTFDAAGLTAEDNTLFVNDTVASTAIDSDGGAVSNSETFPKGVTIYGRWTSIKLDSGKVIAYVGA